MYVSSVPPSLKLSAFRKTVVSKKKLLFEVPCPYKMKRNKDGLEGRRVVVLISGRIETEVGSQDLG
jgi:hypothetical protein